MPAEPLWILAERVLIQQILIILFSNALDAMERIPVGRRRVRVRARAAGDGVRITVQDEGQGIEAALLPRIFEPFETHKQNGMGMGLAIARRIVRSHGGEIRIRSHMGAGTTVSFWLPRVTHSGDQPRV